MPRLRRTHTAVIFLSILSNGLSAPSGAESSTYRASSGSVDANFLAQQAMISTYFPHLGDGVVPGIGSLKSVLIVANSDFTSRVSGSIGILSSDGTDLPLPVAGNTASRWVFDLAPGEVAVLESLGTSSPAVGGWALVESDGPIAGTILFQFLDPNGDLLSEAGIGSGVKRKTFSILATKQGKINTGVAIANPNGENVDVAIRVTDGQLVIDKTISLGTNQHTAFFIDELGSQFNAFYGTLLIEAPAEIIVTVLRTTTGFPSASLPAE